jgi:hypothetical protein
MYIFCSGVTGKKSRGQYNIFIIIKTLTPLPQVKISTFIPQKIVRGRIPPLSPQLHHCIYYL